MERAYRLKIAGITDTGHVRSNNEDAIAWNTQLGIALLSDGVGGNKAGEIASEMATKDLLKLLDDKLTKSLKLSQNEGVSQFATLIKMAISSISKQIFTKANTEEKFSRMAATLVAVVLYENKIVVAHVGDSRIYRLRNDRFEVLTKDHSLINEMVDNGAVSPEDASTNPYQNVITRALGMNDKVDAEIQELDVITNDVYLMCSDGLYGMISDTEVWKMLADTKGNWEQCVQDLVNLANERGCKDNISIIILHLA